MFSIARFYFFLFYIFIYCVTTEATKDGNKSVTITMDQQIKFENREIYGKFVKLHNYSTTEFNFDKLPGNTNFTFLVFQAHSFKDPITLYQNNKAKGNVVSGTNIGMVSTIKHGKTNHQVTDVYYIENNNGFCLNVYVSVHVYYETDPYPGGCNNEFELGIAPYLKVNTMEDYINIDAAVASLDSKCTVTYDNLSRFFMMYLPEKMFDEVQYFNGLKKMMTLDYITEYGTLIPQTSNEMRRTLSAYPGVGVIVVAVAGVTVNNNTAYSVYVPNHSYGCPNLDEDGCNKPHGILDRAFRMGLPLIGMFVAYFGHRNFKGVMFVSGYFTGFIGSYIWLGQIVGKCPGSQFGLFFLISGLTTGTIWLIFCCLVKPVFSLFLPALNVGFLLASYFYYGAPPLGLVLVDDDNFWNVFILIAVLAAISLVSTALARLNSVFILCCSVIGSFIAMFGLDCCVQSNMEYIIYNTIRRAIIPNFRFAIIAPILQGSEKTMMTTWLIFAFGGFLYQHLWIGEKAPFRRPSKNIGKGYQRLMQQYGAANINIKITTKNRLEPRPVMDTIKTFKTYLVGRNTMNQEKTPLIPA